MEGKLDEEVKTYRDKRKQRSIELCLVENQ